MATFSSRSFLIGLCVLLGVIIVAQACNQAVCASLVSKCLLLESCECDMRSNCTCCKDCYTCLHSLYTECCSCVGMCPEQNADDTRLSERSSVEQLKEPIPSLFSVLTEEQDHLQRFSVFSFPAHRDIAFFNRNFTSGVSFEFSIPDQMGSSRTLEIDDDLSINCTVAYMSQCMSMHKCKLSCSSMGASSYRWFHDGCCECVGHTCYNYGMNVSKCLLCSEDEVDTGENEIDDDEDGETDEYHYEDISAFTYSRKDAHDAEPVDNNEDGTGVLETSPTTSQMEKKKESEIKKKSKTVESKLTSVEEEEASVSSDSHKESETPTRTTESRAEEKDDIDTEVQ